MRLHSLHPYLIRLYPLDDCILPFSPIITKMLRSLQVEQSVAITCFVKKIKALFYSLNTLSGVTSERCPTPRLCAKAHTIKVAMVASRWQRVGYLIGSRFEPHTSRTRSELLPLVPSGR